MFENNKRPKYKMNGRPSKEDCICGKTEIEPTLGKYGWYYRCLKCNRIFNTYKSKKINAKAKKTLKEEKEQYLTQIRLKEKEEVERNLARMKAKGWIQ